MEKVNLREKLATFSDHWNPRIVAELNGQQVKLVKFQGPFTWHHHDNEDELFSGGQGPFPYGASGTVTSGWTKETSWSSREASSTAPSRTKRFTSSSSSRPPRSTPATSRTSGRGGNSNGSEGDASGQSISRTRKVPAARESLAKVGWRPARRS